MTGAVTISIDLELAWGNWDNLGPVHRHHVEHSERQIVRRLVDLLDRHDIPVTWAFVAALLDQDSARGREGPEHWWYAPDVINMIRSARTAHDLGSHGGRHIYLDGVSKAEADADLSFARQIHNANGLPFRSFVFPRNRVADAALLKRHGLQVYRGTDLAWHERVRAKSTLAGRAANLLDKMLPLSPETVEPDLRDGLVNLPGSLLFLGREGVRKLVSPAVMKRKLEGGVAAAERRGGVFHLWFHPSNFWHEPETQFALFAEFLAHVAKRRGTGALDVRPMAAFDA